MLAMGTTMKATTRSWGRTDVVTSMTMATDSAACVRRIACSLEELSAELLQALRRISDTSQPFKVFLQNLDFREHA